MPAKRGILEIHVQLRACTVGKQRKNQTLTNGETPSLVESLRSLTADEALN